MADVYFSFLYISNANGLRHLSFSWNYLQDNSKEMKYGYYMLNLKREIPMYCYLYLFVTLISTVTIILAVFDPFLADFCTGSY